MHESRSHFDLHNPITRVDTRLNVYLKSFIISRIYPNESKLQLRATCWTTRLPLNWQKKKKNHFSYTRTKWSRYARRSCIKWSCKETPLNKCGDSRWRRNWSRIPIDRTSCAVTSAGSKIRAWQCRMVIILFIFFFYILNKNDSSRLHALLYKTGGSTRCINRRPVDRAQDPSSRPSLI